MSSPDEALHELKEGLAGGHSPTRLVEKYERTLGTAARLAEDRRWLLIQAQAHLQRLLKDANRARDVPRIVRIIQVMEALATAAQQR